VDLRKASAERVVAIRRDVHTLLDRPKAGKAGTHSCGEDPDDRAQRQDAAES
jgi:hypothetical protein